MTVANYPAWSETAPLPTLRGGCASAVVNNRLYVLGGGLSARKPVAAVESYDPQTNQWSTHAPMPQPRNNVVAAVLNGKIYVAAGLADPSNGTQDPPPENEPSDHVDIYDPETDSWSAAAPLPEARVKPGLCVLNGRLYALGGRHGQVNTPSIAEYDPVANSWMQVASLPIAVRHGYAAALRGSIYMSGGWSPDGEKGTIHAEVCRFDPATGVVEAVAPMPEARAAHCLLAWDDQLLALGGVTADKSFVEDVSLYDPAIDRWTTLDFKMDPRGIFAAGIIGGQVHVAGGWTKLYKEPHATAQTHVL